MLDERGGQRGDYPHVSCHGARVGVYVFGGRVCRVDWGSVLGYEGWDEVEGADGGEEEVAEGEGGRGGECDRGREVI